MSRKLPILALIVVGLHVCEVLILGTSPTGSIVANTLQLVACGLATAMALGASRRGRGLSRPFWLLVGLGMATWGVANVAWMYYENWLRVPVPELSAARIMFDLQGVFFAIAVFLDKERDSERFDLETLLDSLQVAIVFFSAFFGLYYVQLLRGPATPSVEMSMQAFYNVINVALVLAAIILVLSVRTQRLRSLYGGLALYLAISAIGGGIADYVQSVGGVPTGTWYDLGWTLPFLVGAIWAGRWKEPAETPAPAVALRRKTLPTFAMKHLMLALAPLIVVVVVAQLGPEWRVMGFGLLGISISCYAARLGISEYRKAQSAEIANRNTLAMDSAINGMAIVGADEKFTYVNPSYARMLGHASPQAMIGKPWREVSNPRDAVPVEDKIRKSIEDHGKWFGPLTIHHADGTVVPMEMAVTRLPDGGVVCVARDITQRLSAQRGWAEAEAKYRALIEHVSAISYIAELGVDGEWLYVSPQVETILGFSPEEWLTDSQKWIRHVHPEDHAIVLAAEETANRGERFQAEYRVTRKDGRVIWVSDTAVVVTGSDSRRSMEGIILDITERKVLEGQLQQARRMEAVGRLAGGIAHDFNNLLTIIKGYTELALGRVKVQPELRTDIERIEDASERAAGLVRQLLAFSRRQVLQPKVLDLNSIVVGLDKLLRRLMDEDIEMVTLVSRSVGAIKADPGQIEQVIMNLVVNARDAMPDGGRLTVETSNVELDASYAKDHASVKPGRYVMLVVSDTGVGMSADTVAHIFEPFYTTKESGRGTGLGLSTVYGIVKQSGGYIWVYSEPGKGSAFKVYLPRVDEPLEAVTSGKALAAKRKGTETVLLVEDDPQVRELTRTVLAAQGYFIIEAAGPEDAERIVENDRSEIHLLLTDVIMPGISGRELAKRLTARLPRLRVLYMSGYTYNIIAHGGNLESGVAFLQKPFTPSALVEKVREVLDAVVPTH
jgi:two-component system cell cycle sensor histidine kinase/response regulator CckA